MQQLEDAMVAAEVVAKDLLQHAKRVGEETRTPLTASLTRLGLIAEEDLAAWLSSEFQVPRWRPSDDLGQVKLPPNVNLTLLQAKRALFIEDEAETWHLVVADPSDKWVLRALDFALGCASTLWIGTEADILASLGSLDKGRNGASTLADVGLAQVGSSQSDDVSTLQDLNSDAPAIRSVNTIFAEAADQVGSDIHIEPLERSVVVRYRTDGMLREADSLAQGMATSVVSRLKVTAKLDIAEKRMPQDGRIRTSIRGQNVDLRVSTTPTIYGESVVLRILGRSATPLNLRDLGLPNASVSAFEDALARPHGIVLVTGPTGSGKTRM